jgi:hypothetical protein
VGVVITARIIPSGHCSTPEHGQGVHLRTSACTAFAPVYYCRECGLCCDANAHGVTLTAAEKCADCYGDPGWTGVTS